MSSGKNQFKNMIKILKKIEEENSDTWPSHESTLFFRHCMTRSIFSEEKQKGGGRLSAELTSMSLDVDIRTNTHQNTFGTAIEV